MRAPKRARMGPSGRVGGWGQPSTWGTAQALGFKSDRNLKVLNSLV